ncbi:hypothetical protein CLV42_105136 [Chitinophaga ginsengisoli]|uniref:Uncharacterized protein n=1 Tax=Chitinophaga ginsengisoli TaxID=363837 RepID=A0A2P8GA49_9BACT|nr:hypothetical protein CLV42_105136 [Chitinophaga ginsengisoli]
MVSTKINILRHIVNYFIKNQVLRIKLLSCSLVLFV